MSLVVAAALVVVLPAAAAAAPVPAVRTPLVVVLVPAGALPAARLIPKRCVDPVD